MTLVNNKIWSGLSSLNNLREYNWQTIEQLSKFTIGANVTYQSLINVLRSSHEPN